MVVAFEIPLPIPRRNTLSVGTDRRWGFVVSRRTNPEDLGETTYPWWRPRGYTLRLAGRAYRLRHGITVWHVEPDGQDSGEVCKQYRRERRPDGSWKTTNLRGWKWHVHHWHLQVHALQKLRRTLLTRCSWCGGPSRKGAPVNVSHSWDGPHGRWWQGAPGLFHSGCSSAESASRACVCDVPVLNQSSWGHCARCGQSRNHGRTPGQTKRLRILQSIPHGEKPSATVMAELHTIADQERLARQTDST